MHELGILMELVKQVSRIAEENDIREVDAIVLQVGEAASVIPYFLRECYPAAVDGTFLEQTALEIETIPANGLCRSCRRVYHLTEGFGVCPHCGIRDFEMLSGREFILKEIRVPWDDPGEETTDKEAM